MMIISEQYAQGKGIRVLRQSAERLADFLRFFKHR